jgi:hypothetical protein
MILIWEIFGHEFLQNLERAYILHVIMCTHENCQNIFIVLFQNGEIKIMIELPNCFFQQ